MYGLEREEDKALGVKGLEKVDMHAIGKIKRWGQIMVVLYEVLDLGGELGLGLGLRLGVYGV